MAIKLKTKVALGGIFLFLLLILVGAVSFYYLNRITEEAGQIVTDNYETLNYSRNMIDQLDKIRSNGDSQALASFETDLQLQEKNITEPGEKEMTESLRKNFHYFKGYIQSDSVRLLIRKDISQIMQVNLEAIDKKNRSAQQSAGSARTIITIMLSVCFLMGFVFLFNFPSLVADPIAKLMDGIQAISNKKYSERIHLQRKDEFGSLAEAFNTMAERLDDYEHSNLAKILFEKQRAEAVINSLQDASIGIDNKGTILFANQHALQLLHLKDQEIVGEKQETVSKRNDLFRYLTANQQQGPFKIVLDGKENYFTTELIKLKQGEDESGTVIVIKNITPYKELDTAKTNFIATVSHELKTPLASSDFSLRLLEDERVGKLTDDQKKLVQSLKDDNKRLLQILSELLDMSQVESGKIQLAVHTVQPSMLAEQALASVQNAASEKHIRLQKEIEENLPDVQADADKTTWILNNFLTNAIRYSPENDRIILAIKKNGNFVQFSVRDFGQGIDPKYARQIFDRYFRVPGTKQGTGLGLAIAREFIEAQGGKIAMDSKLGEGSLFRFDLPITT